MEDGCGTSDEGLSVAPRPVVLSFVERRLIVCLRRTRMAAPCAPEEIRLKKGRAGGRRVQTAPEGCCSTSAMPPVAARSRNAASEAATWPGLGWEQVGPPNRELKT